VPTAPPDADFPQGKSRGGTDDRYGLTDEHGAMSSYAVLWSEPLRDIEAGKLELEPGGLRFEGSRGPCGHRVERIYYDDIDGVRIGHGEPERLRGRPVVVVDLAEGGSLRIGSVDGVGTVSELADELTRLSRRYRVPPVAAAT
jgi:hypothetical protein